MRDKIIGQLESRLRVIQNLDDDLFYRHTSEDRIVLSHALFWVMTASIKGKIGKESHLSLLRKFQKEMLEAWLMESPDFHDILHYCNVMYNILPIVLNGTYNLTVDKDARKLAAICVVAGGYGGDMPEKQANELLDDIGFYCNNVKCRKIEKLLPVLGKLVMEEQQTINQIMK